MYCDITPSYRQTVANFSKDLNTFIFGIKRSKMDFLTLLNAEDVCNRILREVAEYLPVDKAEY